MRVAFTVVDGRLATSTDLLVDAPDDTPMERVAAAMIRGGDASSDGMPSGADVAFADSGIVEGSVVHTGGARAPRFRDGVVELLLVGGRGAGELHRRGPGSVPIAADAGGRLHVGATAIGLDGAEARIAFDGTVTVRSVVGERATSIPTLDSALLAREFVAWTPGAVLTLGESLLTVRAVEPAAPLLATARGTARLDYNRPPRLRPAPPVTVFRIPRAPVPPRSSPIPWLMALLPAVVGVAMAIVLRSPFYLLFAAMSPIMVVGQAISSRVNGRRSHRQLLAEHTRRVASTEADIADAVSRERDRRRHDAPSAAALRIAATTPTARLWERRPTDVDHLRLRVGSADLTSEVTVVDERDDRAEELPARSVLEVPVTLDLAHVGVIGIAGPGDRPRRIGRWLIGQLAVTQSPQEVRVAVLTSAQGVPHWHWATWLPHSRTEDGALALVGSDQDSTGRRLAELNQLLAERRASRERGTSIRGRFTPEVIVVLDGARRLRSMPGVVGLLRDGPSHGIHVICLDTEEWLLPEECGATVVADLGSRVEVRQQGADPIYGIRPDLVDDDWFDEVARAVAPLRDVSGSESAGLIPDSARLVDVLGFDRAHSEAIIDRWRHRPASTEAVVGVGIDGAFAVDLVRDGPHALVAGTTGSGKSEFLQTLVASLAVANRPDAMNFVLIDYKGGAAFAACVDMPHTVGVVTDLDSHLVERALRSLRAELSRRERVLAAVEAKDIEDYERYRARADHAEAIPRLVLVIDEFAAMVSELPTFVSGLIGIAQRGRSLGVHLVLATQRPGGIVGPDIRANTNLRVALRMTDPGESQDVIDVRDAARIPKSTPGRGFVRLGHASVVPFQSARVGGPAPLGGAPELAAPEVHPIGWHERATGLPDRVSAERDDTLTDLGVLVGALREAHEQTGLPDPRSPWLPPLPAALVLEAEPVRRDGALSFAWGREDLPDRQLQRDAVIDLDHFGHRYIIGAPGSGRSQALRTMAVAAAQACSPADVHLYAIDCGNGALASLDALPHCGAVVQRTQQERVIRLVDRLSRELQHRHELIGSMGAADIAEQRARSSDGGKLPHLVVLVDRWENFTATFGDHDGGALVDAMQTLLRDGAGAGIHLVLAGDRSLLSSRMSVLTDDKIVLRLTERLDYGMAGVNARDLPAEIPPGRGFRAETGVEVQIAVLGDDVTGQGQNTAVREVAERLRPDGGLSIPRPFRIDPLPRDVDLDTALALEGTPRPAPLVAVTGIGGDDTRIQTVDLSDGSPTFVVAGPARSGRSTMLAVMARSLLAGGTELVVIAPRPGAVRELGGLQGVRAMFTEDDVSEDELRAHLDPDGAPVVLVVDDGELLLEVSARNWLRTFVRTAGDNRRGMLLGGNAAGLATGFGGWQVDAKRNRRGALLSPIDMVAGDLVGVRLPRSAIVPRVVPGTALVHVGDGVLRTQQVPLVPPTTVTGSASTRARLVG